VIGGKVSRERAAKFYGVVVDERTYAIDERATTEARKLMTKSRESNN
jgi:hypothetical protein